MQMTNCARAGKLVAGFAFPAPPRAGFFFEGD